MMAVHSQGANAWWRQLSDFLHQRTENRLRRLTIRTLGGRVTIQATAPSDRIRDLAEAAAREAVPPEMLALLIRVEGPTDEALARSSSPPLPASDRITAPKLFVGDAIHRRLQRLVTGN